MADYGLQVKDLAGNVILKITDRLTRLVGSVNTGIANGSLAIPNPGNGAVFFVIQPISGTVLSTNTAPVVTLSGSTLTWTFPAGTANSSRVAALILYGVY